MDSAEHRVRKKFLQQQSARSPPRVPVIEPSYVIPARIQNPDHYAMRQVPRVSQLKVRDQLCNRSLNLCFFPSEENNVWWVRKLQSRSPWNPHELNTGQVIDLFQNETKTRTAILTRIGALMPGHGVFEVSMSFIG